jgi:hypothetical protein
MAAGNRTPLRFSVIASFHLAVLGVGVAIQNVHSVEPEVAYVLLGAVACLGAIAGYIYRRFLFDIFRGFKSAAVLITLLVLSCILGTVFIQDLDLRRADVFTKGDEDLKEGELPPFDNRTQITRFALAEAHGLLWLFPNGERSRLMEAKVRLSPVEKKRIELREKAFGGKAARALEEGLLASKRKNVEELTTSNYARAHFEGFYSFYKVVRGLRLFDIFEAWWFYLLLALIATNVIVGTFVRAPWSPRDWGLAITHGGVLIILSGALLDVLTAEEGYIQFVYGQPENQISSRISDMKTRTFTNLPFRVRLDRFATEYFHKLHVRRHDWTHRHDGRAWEEGRDRGTPFFAWNNYAIRTGVPRVFEGGQVRITVKKYQPRVFVQNTIAERKDGKLNPGIELAVYNRPEGGPNLLRVANYDPWLFAFDSQRRALDREGFVIEYVWANSDAEYRRLVDKAPLPDNGTLILRSGDEQVKVPVRLGREVRIPLGDRALSLHFFQIRSALADSKNVNLDDRMQRSEEPLLYLQVNGRDISVPRDDREFMSDFAILPGIDLRFDWPDPSDHGVTSIYRVVGAANRPAVLVQANDEDKCVTRALGSRPIALGGRLEGYYLGMVKKVQSAEVTREIEEVSDERFLTEGGGAQDHMLAAYAEVVIEGPHGTVEATMTPGDRAVTYGKDEMGRPLYAFALVRTENARDWFSVLTVVDNQNRVVKTHNVQVNSPLRYGGYRFFQASAGKTREGLGVSGISVTNNPGVNFMYVGYAVLTLGVSYIFFIKPIIDRRRRRRRGEAA